MKKRFKIVLFVLCFTALLVGCGNQESVADTSSDEATEESSADVVVEDTMESTMEESVIEEATTEDITDSSTSDINTKFDMKQYNVAGLYEFYSCGVIINEDGKFYIWNTWEIPEKKVLEYEVIDVKIKTEFNVVSTSDFTSEEVLGENVYFITGKSANGEEVLLATDGRSLYSNMVYNEYHNAYDYTIGAKRVHSIQESNLEYLPSDFVIPTFEEVVYGIELDNELFPLTTGIYHGFSADYYIAERNEFCFVVDEDGYLYKWDSKGLLSPQGQWSREAIFKVVDYRPEGYDAFLIETPYESYTFAISEERLKFKYVKNYIDYTARLDKVNALPETIPAYK